MGELRIGTSGWSYKEWEGVFYPKGEKNKLSYYSKYFDTVEIDSTFYAYPKKAMIQGCARTTPDNFVFTAKIPKLITHDKKLDVEKGIARDLYRFLHDMRPLMDARKLGPLLIQLPPSFTYETGLLRLIHFFEVLPTDVKFAIEFRNKSWLRHETWDLLKKCNIANTIVDEPLLPADTVVTADFSFIRFHGQGKAPWYNYRYSDKEIKLWAPKVKEVEAATAHAYTYFNNHFRGNAPENALKLLRELGKATPAQIEKQKMMTHMLDEAPAAKQTKLVWP
jgi:uncharacterized protein YecE (DUF72 family)